MTSLLSIWCKICYLLEHRGSVHVVTSHLVLGMCLYCFRQPVPGSCISEKSFSKHTQSCAHAPLCSSGLFLRIEEGVPWIHHVTPGTEKLGELRLTADMFFFQIKGKQRKTKRGSLGGLKFAFKKDVCWILVLSNQIQLQCPDSA